MSYYRGFHHGGPPRGGGPPGMNNFGGPPGGNRFGILPVTRPRMQGGMYNQGGYGGGHNNWNNNFRGGPRPRRK